MDSTEAQDPISVVAGRRQASAQAYFFHDVIEGIRIITQEEWQGNVASLHIPELLPVRSCVIIEIDRFHLFSESYSLRDQNLLRFTLVQAFKEHAETFGGTVWSDWNSPSQFCSLVQFSELQPGVFEEMLDQYHKWSNQHLKFSITMGVGRLADQINSKHFYDLFARFQRIAQSILIRDEAWLEKFSEAFANMKGYRISRDDIVRLLLYFICQLEQLGHVKPHEQLREYQQCLDNMRTQIDRFEELERPECNGSDR